MLNELQKTLAQAEFLSVLTDGSTDSSVVEKELMYVLFVNSNGYLEHRFLKLKNVRDGTAPGLKTLLEQSFKELGISHLSSHLVGLGADGASVNMGCKKGLVALMKRKQPWLIGNHCFNHCLELALKKAFDDTYMNSASDTLVSLYYLYQNSPKRLCNLRKIAQIMDEKVKKPLKCHGTRGVQHKLHACQALLESYSVIATHLESMVCDPAQDQNKAKGILKQLTSCKFVLHVIFFAKL